MDNEVVLDKNMIIVSETNEKGIITFASDDFCTVAGFSLDELVGNPHSMVRHPDMPKAAFEDLWETIKSGNIWNGIVKNRTKSGGYYWVNATAYSSITPNGDRRYISIRVAPTKEEIQAAKEIYKALI